MDTKIGLLDASKPVTCNDVGSLPSSGVSPIQSSAVPFNSAEATLGLHLARRLVQIGLSDVFSIPDDFNLTLFDHLIAEPGLNLVGCYNKLNAGYARARGVGVCIVSFTRL